jgi:hypothetical protein
MALTDPQSLVIGANTRTLARTSTSASSSVYTDLDNGVEFVVSTQTGKRRRTSIRENNKKIAADPITAVNKEISSSVYIVIDGPITGFTRTELKDQVLALATWCSTGSAANLLKALGGES